MNELMSCGEVTLSARNQQDADHAKSPETSARAEVVEGALYEERDVKKLLLQSAILSGLTGIAIGYWLGTRERRW